MQRASSRDHTGAETQMGKRKWLLEEQRKRVFQTEGPQERAVKWEPLGI